MGSRNSYSHKSLYYLQEIVPIASDKGTSPPSVVHGAHQITPSVAQRGGLWVDLSQSSGNIVPSSKDFNICF